MTLWIIGGAAALALYLLKSKKTAKATVAGKSGILWDVEGSEVTPMPGAAVITNATVSYKGAKIITYSQIGADISQRLLTWSNPAAEAAYYVAKAKEDFAIAAPLVQGPTAADVMNR